jgi:predicted nucleotidyltransferase component of viral defense system
MDILTSFQNHFLKAISKTPLRNSFWLTGGTALAAFYLQHRFSEDLDFFTDNPAAMLMVPETLKKLSVDLGGTLEIQRSFETFLSAVIKKQGEEAIKLDFAVDSPFRLQPVVDHPELKIRIENAMDLACNKVSALFDRYADKDFTDIYFIVKELFPMEEVIKNAQRKHIGMEPHWLAKAFLRVQDLRTLPRMIKPLRLEELQPFFMDHARHLMDQLK